MYVDWCTIKVLFVVSSCENDFAPNTTYQLKKFPSPQGLNKVIYLSSLKLRREKQKYMKFNVLKLFARSIRFYSLVINL